MSKRWSKLQSRLFALMDPNAEFQIHCALYEMNSNSEYHSYKVPRYWITIGKEIVFDYPKNFDTENILPWSNDISNISNLLEKYIQRSEKKIMNSFDDDIWGITEILRACDKRVGKRRLLEIKEASKDPVILNIIDRRLGISLFDDKLNLKNEILSLPLSEFERDILKQIRYYPQDKKEYTECDYKHNCFEELPLEHLYYIRDNEEFRDVISDLLKRAQKIYMETKVM